MRPLAIDLFCGLGGWTEGLLAEQYNVVGFDIERHVYGDQKYPAQLVLQDIHTIHGKQFRNAQLIVASPPCQEFSYMAMPWSRAKQIARALRGKGDFPDGYRGSRTIQQLRALFDACFRIQREACEAAGRHVPMVVENVKGAQPWVGPAAWSFGSFYLWGDVPAPMPIVRRAHRKNGGGGSWFSVSHGVDNGQTYGTNPVRGEGVDGVKQHGSGAAWFDKALDERRKAASEAMRNGTKVSGDWFGTYGDMKAAGTISPTRTTGKGTTARKAASAQIAKIPLPLAQHIARCYR